MGEGAMANQRRASHGRPDVSSEVDHADQSNPQVRECMADVTVALRGVLENLLAGAHIRQHRRSWRLARGSLIAAAILLITLVIATADAVGQRNPAIAVQHTAIARGMVAQADRIRDLDDLRGSTQLGVAAQKTVIRSDYTHQPRRLGQPLTGYAEAVTGVAFSPDGRTLATSPLILWDLSDLLRPQRLDSPLIGHTDVVDSVAFSPGGRTLATGSRDSSVILWDLTDRNHPHRLGRAVTGPGWVTSVVLSPDGRTLATSIGDRTVILWDLTSNQLRPIGQPLSVFAGVAAFSPDGRALATVSDERTITLWDLTDRNNPRRFDQALTGPGWVMSVVFSPDGRTLASASGDRTITLWDLTQRNRPRRLGQPLTGHTDAVNAVAFSPDGRTLATASDDRTVILWDLTDRNQPRRLGQPLTGHTDAVNAVAFSPDGRTLATGSRDKTVTLWDLTPA
jgi:WD40 repeat protein